MTAKDFEHIATDLRPRLIKIGRDFFGNDSMADDIAQETLMRLWVMRDRIDMRRGVEPLAVRMAKNLCVSEWRKMHNVSIEVAETSTITVKPTTTLEEDDNQRLLSEAKAQLTRPELRLFVMRHEMGMDNSEIVAATGILPRSVSAMLSGARRKVYEFLKKRGGLDR